MRYWKALAFCQHKLCRDEWRHVSLDEFSAALDCTRRNTQLVIKRLVKEQVLDWRSGIGRGNLPTAKLVKDVSGRVIQQAHRLIEGGQIENALALVNEGDKDRFLSDYLARYQSTPQTQDVLQIPFYRATHDLDPIGINRRTEQHIASYLYATLLKPDNSPEGYCGDLAHTWRLDNNALIITLRKGLTFHDGSPIYAQDILRHFERLMASTYMSKALYQFIDEVVAEDRYTLRFISHSLPELLPKLLAHGAMGISKQVGDTIYGSGSFVLSEQNEWRTLLTANHDYHGHRPWVDGVEIWNVGSNAKSFDLHSDVVHGHHLTAEQRSQFTVCHQWERGCVHAMLNPQRHPWMKTHAHRAALQTMMLAMGQPEGEQCEVLARASGMLSTPSDIGDAPLDLIDNAIKPLPTPETPLQLVTYQLGTHIETAQLIAQTLQNLNVPCQVDVLEFPDFNQAETLARADIIVTGEVFSEDLEMSWLGWLLCTRSNEACLTPKDKHWLLEQVIDVMQHTESVQRLAEFEKLEQRLVTKALYQPLFHIQQDLNVSNHISAPEMLANGWIDFNKITF